MKGLMKWFISALAILILTVPVAANGTPIKIFLNYLPELSNHGPTDATGVALVSIGEAWIDLKAEGLPQLSGQLYEAWLVTVETGEMISLGKFNADTTGHITYYAEFDQLPDVEYRYFVISVEPDPDPSLEPNPRRTVAGVFPNLELLVVSGPPTPTLEPGVTPPPAPPPTLPITGKVTSQMLSLGLLVFGIGLGITGLMLLRRKRVSRYKE